MERQNSVKTKRSRVFSSLVAVLVLLALLGATIVTGINLYVVHSTRDRILTAEQAAEIAADCILVLGAGLRGDGSPSTILADRIDCALNLYDAGASDRLLMSGDHSRVDYDEVSAMKAYAVKRGAASDEVFLDHAGFSTYESMYRARDVFKVQKVIIVTQSYHLYRALYVAQKLGLEAYGVASDVRPYARQSVYDVREIMARCKDFLCALCEPEPTYLGSAIPVSGNGDQTNSIPAYPIGYPVI